MIDPSIRKLSSLDRILTEASRALFTIYGKPTETRPYPATSNNPESFSNNDRRRSAAYMRVNHTGEVCAQALYQSQAMTARQSLNQAYMQHSANEEIDHLAWCEQRMNELGGRKSLLNPLWYAGSFVIGAVAGLIGDKWNLGFVAETENQVVEHLESHLTHLPETDLRSREVIEQMKADEAQHASQAVRAGAATLPTPIKFLMKIGSRIMTRTAYRI
ncbi:MAG: 2-polyprenyl-3-methyl-6-methoxy-1,4-benzoquinone monooxygenase [Gammaproteobacteria bacterium]|nr:2-polyprenyl-3-methyl-6-methoxy-1,4-benzoquinone monooxygenase [Gammaproteobacteria bacterium]MCY4219767.1 2-polyprenyl-3-methyl-6-methoxy-1,4-benzoquinone monooxygenase [Gammaproteobacteria bacterium]MCY4275348.1 2-polyprenyl-3-methyl-6-methoxy-1,4-benzoquinone monooxygenase [Gammaproteobacteria bacterium]